MTNKDFIDGMDSSRGNVIKLMMGEGVDIEHYKFLILQGR